MKFFQKFKNIIASNKGKTNDVVDYVIALAGNPNVGKSTVFNELTGLNQHTGNWPGKTVVTAEGIYKYKNKNFKVIDLPGTYSLLSNSEEEEVARDYICFEKYDLVVVVADATSLERNLNLFMQIKEYTDKVILCVNLIDEANKKGIEINYNGLESELKAKVVKTSAREGTGIEELKNTILKEVNRENQGSSKLVEYPLEIEEGINKIINILDLNLDYKKERWIALRYIEGESDICNKLEKRFNLNEEEKLLLDKFKDKELADEIASKIIIKAEEIGKNNIKLKEEYSKRDRKLDKILTSKVTGIPIMIIVLLIVLWITVTLANYPSELLANFFSYIEDKLRLYLSSTAIPAWISSVFMDGIYTTLAWVISVMLPPMAIFFPLFTLLEDFGYLPRIAFNLDNVFRKCKSCGKQALTMCMGLGCNAAGVIGCRIINSPREKLIAILTNNFMPCNGRFPMIITISTIFVGGLIGNTGGSFLSALTITCVIIIGVFATFIVSKILSSTLLKGVGSNFILELPPYRKPQIGKVIVRSIFDRTLHVLGRAVVVAAPAGIIIWIFANIQCGNGTLLSTCADFLKPLGNAIGLDGYILMAFILGLPANEIVLPIIIMSYLNTTTMLELDSIAQLRELLVSNGWTMLTAINVILLSLMHYPCATTLLTIKKETGSIKWSALAFLIPTVCGIGICFLTTTACKIFF